MYQKNLFHSFFDRFIYFNFLLHLVALSIIINKKILTKMFVLIVMNKIISRQIIRNRRNELFK